MNSRQIQHSGSLLATGMLLFMTSAVGLSNALAARNQPDASSLQKLRSMAEAQHEIAVLLLRKKEYAKAADEAAKIFEMKWPSDQEPLLLKELSFFTDQFLHQDQATIGIQLLEKSENNFKATSSRVQIWKEKGYLYKHLQQPDRALECFREAQRLEKSLK